MSECPDACTATLRAGTLNALDLHAANTGFQNMSFASSPRSTTAEQEIRCLGYTHDVSMGPREGGQEERIQGEGAQGEGFWGRVCVPDFLSFCPILSLPG